MATRGGPINPFRRKPRLAEQFQPLMDAMGVPATFVRSGLGAHATAMFLDDRASTRQVREWYRELVG